MDYKGYITRRQILGDEQLTDFGKVIGSILVDHIDWATGEKKVYSASHLNNWLSGLAEQYGIFDKDGKPYVKALKSGMESLITLGYMKLSNDGLLKVMQKPVIEEDPEA